MAPGIPPRAPVGTPEHVGHLRKRTQWASFFTRYYFHPSSVLRICVYLYLLGEKSRPVGTHSRNWNLIIEYNYLSL